ncbi:MAG TPA: tRNA dihydrouridine synthase DusB [Candidatus Limiplasma sp.]|nr:tRNA dihydrouridine synthase DusB [Candidatus Limiplasma sp.]HPS80745.1 tRNA dihydrouridine synthase DusB [Candidatus Limiplasma sp.]
MTEKQPGRVIGLAPMAGVTDMPMRALCYRMGANYACTEMVSAIGWMCAKKDNPAYRLLLETAPEESNTAVQLFGKDPVLMAEAAARACEMGRFTAIDINMGCPARKVTSSGEGSALLKTPELAAKIMEAVKTHSFLPVTVKTRLGYDGDSMNALLLAQAAEAYGLQWICIHGRTRAQMYSGQADYHAIAAVKRQVGIPVLANGDVSSAAGAVQALQETGCDGLLIGRGAMGNPWLFREIRQSLNGEPVQKVSPEERLTLALEHIDRMMAFKGESLGVAEMRTHIGHYISGVRGASAMRRALNTARTAQEQKRLLGELFAREEQEENG